MTLPIPWAPLFPSQRSGESAREMARWRGDWREFWVQWHEDRVYFQLVQGEPTVWASLETCAPDEALACFEDAVRERRYGVCFEQCTSIYARRGMLSFRFQFIYAPDGTGFLREWCSRDWIAFAPNETRGWAFFPHLHLPQIGAEESRYCCIDAVKSVREQILFRCASKEEIERLTWKCATNQTEFEQTMSLLWDAGLLIGTSGYASVSNAAPNPVATFQLKGLECDLALRQWLSVYFVGEGFERNARKWGKRRYRHLRARKPNLSAFFEWDSVYWGHLFSHGKPSAHQQLEARLQLRAWLQERATPDEVERLLAPDAQLS